MTRPDRRLFLAGCLLILGAQTVSGKVLDALGRPVDARPEGRILSLGPDITEIIAAEDIGPPEVLEFLRHQPIPLVLVPRDFSLDGIVTKIAIIAAALDRQSEGRDLSARIAAEYRAAEARSRDIPDDARRRAVFFHGLASFSAAGSDTAAGEILRAAGARNIFADHSGYLSASPELILERDPQVVVLMPDGKGGPTPEHVFAIPAFAGTEAAHTGGLIVLDDNLMIGFGPRTAAQIGKLARLLYP